MTQLRRRNNRPAVIAHRGAPSSDLPENSRAAFDRAVSLGFDGLETDVQVSSDGVLIIQHDEDVSTTTDGLGIASTLTWKQLCSLRKANGESIMSAAEFFERYPDVYVNVDVKTDEALVPAIKFIDSLDAADKRRICVGSFSSARLTELRSHLGPQVSTCLSAKEVLRLLLAAKTASSPYAWKVPGQEIGAVAAQVSVDAYGIKVIDRRFVAAAHQRGLAVHAWTINDLTELRHLHDIGVDAVFTDEPALLDYRPQG
ncbi:MAG: glycerophosphodiester phosphodiesterase family protein [Actinomycetaceae bacterium]|nr:glycerophosphodiester phosphodiesterase family protein [Actinomycetaceae bacterium]